MASKGSSIWYPDSNYGTVAAWGDNTYGQSAVPSGLTGVVAVAAGDQHSLALKLDGTVVAWGGNAYGQLTVPDGLTDVIAVAAGGYHSIALKRDGTVTAWGQIHNDSGYVTERVPVGLTGVVAIAAGVSHSLALVGSTSAIAIQVSGNNIVLSWPLSAQNFTLQSTTNLTDKSSWTNSLVTMDSQNRVTNKISGGARFFRLKK